MSDNEKTFTVVLSKDTLATSNFDVQLAYLIKVFVLYRRAMWALGDISSTAWEWAHDRELDYTTKEYQVANSVLEKISKQASEIHSEMFRVKWEDLNLGNIFTLDDLS